jgi:hypothetical protein
MSLVCTTVITDVHPEDGFAGHYIQAGVAQWQSSGFVNRRLEVQFLSPAPNISVVYGYVVESNWSPNNKR